MRCPSPTSSMPCSKGSIDGKRSTCGLQVASDTPSACPIHNDSDGGHRRCTKTKPARSRSSWLLGGLPAVVTGAGAGLVPASPPRPAQPMAEVVGGTDEQRGEQVLDLVAGQADQSGWWRVLGAVAGRKHHQEGVGHHG